MAVTVKPANRQAYIRYMGASYATQQVFNCLPVRGWMSEPALMGTAQTRCAIDPRSARQRLNWLIKHEVVEIEITSVPFARRFARPAALQGL